MGHGAAVRLLTLRIQEPLPGQVLPEMAADHGAHEAARRYRAIVVTTLRQLRGLADARLRLEVDPSEAHEAVRFWLLPRLAAKWRAEELVFHADGWQIDFGGDADPFEIQAIGEVLCPNLGARWAHAAMLGLGRSTHRVIGPASGGGQYFQASFHHTFEESSPRILPELPIIQSSSHWSEALDGPLGPALRRAWEEESD